MKKTIILFLAISTAIQSYSTSVSESVVQQGKEIVHDVKTATIEVLDSTKQTLNEINRSEVTNKIYDDVSTAVSAMATSLKTTVDELWGIIVKQQLVYAISSLLTLIFLFILLRFFYSKLKAVIDKDSDFQPLWILITLMIMGYSVISYFLVPIVLTGFINPEFGAIKMISEFIK